MKSVMNRNKHWQSRDDTDEVNSNITNILPPPTLKEDT
jgi:hypothetical protein